MTSEDITLGRALLRLIGEPPAGSRQADWLPLARTWHLERQKWQAEVETLQQEIRRLEAILYTHTK